MGALQDSILGSLLFSAYVNDLPSVGVETLMYADDMVLYVHGKDPEQVAAKITSTIHNTQNVDEFKYLGATIYSTLTFKRNIKKMCQVLKYNIVHFRHSRNSLTADIPECNDFFLFTLLYIMLVTVLNPIQTFHKQALKVFYRKSRQYHYCNILVKQKNVKL